MMMTISSSVADPGCFIPDPGSEFFPSRILIFPIPDPNFSIPDPNFLHPGTRIRLKEFKYFNPKKTGF